MSYQSQTKSVLDLSVRSRDAAATMFQISRQLYRELAPELDDPRHRADVLRACEATVHRLVTDRHYFAHPARTLFDEIRWHFPLDAQTRVLAVIERRVASTRALLETANSVTYELSGVKPCCRATTRKSRNCGHPPDPRTGYCSFHRHLADDVEYALTA